MHSNVVAHAVKRILFNLTPKPNYSRTAYNTAINDQEVNWLEGYLEYEKSDFADIQLVGEHRANAMLFFEGFVKHHTGDIRGGRRCMVASLQAKHVDIAFIEKILTVVDEFPDKILDHCMEYGISYLPELEEILEPLNKNESFCLSEPCQAEESVNEGQGATDSA